MLYVQKPSNIWISLLALVLILGACTALAPSAAQETISTALAEEPEISGIDTSLPLTSAAETLPTPTETPVKPAREDVRVSEADGMEQVFIPAGEFIIGWQGTDATIEVLPGPFPDFLEHTVFLDGYWMDKYAVTNGQYQRCQ